MEKPKRNNLLKNIVGDYSLLKSKYVTQPFPKLRNFVIDAGLDGSKKSLIYITFELDVTDAKKIMKGYKDRTGNSLSFTTFILCCYAKAIDENKVFHAILKRKKKLILFDDVDLCVLVEKEIEGSLQPIFYILRNANKKTFTEIQTELRNLKDMPYEEIFEPQTLRFFKSPKLIRRTINVFLEYFPHLKKLHKGTAAITSMGMFGSGTAATIPLIAMSSSLSIGTITTRPVLEDGNLENRDFLNLVLTLDHDVIDGAPGMRFISRMKELVSECYSIPGVKDYINTAS